MIRTLATLLFVGASAMLSAQHRDIIVTDSDAMRANARKHTELVDRTVGLTAEQTTQVNDMYMQVERQVDGMNQRMDMAGMTEADKKAEMAPQWALLEQMVANKLDQIFTPEQRQKWLDATK